jgi:hypothetical protein
MFRAKQQGLLIIVLLIFFLRTFANSNSGESNPDATKCYQVYVCCKKIDFECIEYCDPFEECGGNGTKKEQVLNVKLCRRGTRLVNGACRKVL